MSASPDEIVSAEPGDVIFETDYCQVRFHDEGRVAIGTGREGNPRPTVVDAAELRDALHLVLKPSDEEMVESLREELDSGGGDDA